MVYRNGVLTKKITEFKAKHSDEFEDLENICNIEDKVDKKNQLYREEFVRYFFHLGTKKFTKASDEIEKKWVDAFAKKSKDKKSIPKDFQKIVDDCYDHLSRQERIDCMVEFARNFYNETMVQQFAAAIRLV